MNLLAMMEPFVETRPVGLMARSVIERLLDPDELDALFERTAVEQYTHELMFSTLAELMCEAVLNWQPSVHAAYQARRQDIPASVTAVYRKLARLELPVCEELVRNACRQAAPVVGKLRASDPSWLTGYDVRVIDGNHLSGTEHRIEELRRTWAAPLPGKALVVYDQSKRLICDVFLTADGHAQERSLFDRVLSRVRPRQLWIADRNFCTLDMLFSIEDADAFFVIRQHGQLTGRLTGRRRKVGQTETGTVYEQPLVITHPATGAERTVRRVTVKLNTPTRDGDEEIHILTNLPAEVTAVRVAQLYRDRWTIENVFFDIDRILYAEINSLGYPPAALFGLCLAFVVYNAVSLLMSAMEKEHGRSTVRERVSPYYLALEIRQTWDGIAVVVDPSAWIALKEQSTAEFAATLRTLAAHANLERYRKHPRGPKKKPPPKTQYKNGGHVSTARLIAKRKSR